MLVIDYKEDGTREVKIVQDWNLNSMSMRYSREAVKRVHHSSGTLIVGRLAEMDIQDKMYARIAYKNSK